jgi:hypothetical protein
MLQYSDYLLSHQRGDRPQFDAIALLGQTKDTSDDKL